MKQSSTKEETDWFQEIKNYLNNASNLRNNPKSLLQKLNWETYLVLWEDDIFEVIKQRWDIYIAYHPIKQTYIVYKFLWEDSDQNTSLLSGLNSIKKTNVDGYYKVEYTRNLEFNKPWDVYWISDAKNHEHTYYFIWENWETQDFWNYRNIWELRKHWNAVFFNWESYWHKKELIIHNWDKVEKIPAWHEIVRKSKSGRHLLYITYESNKGMNMTETLFDLDSMKIIFEQANRFWYKISFSEGNIWTYDNNIFWEHHEKREWVAKLLWKKVIKHCTEL